MKLLNHYFPKDIEEKIYNYWIENGYFYSIPDKRPSYSIVIPPPNITGILHIGHILNNTLQDILVRRARMKGYNVCWVPGTDHASIATEAKIVDQLKKEKTSKNQIGRKIFLERAWKWTYEHKNIILNQLKKLGCSCDWKRTCFTMDKKLSNSVNQCFIDLYRRGFIYKEYRMVHWDFQAKTTISDEEIFYKEYKGSLYYIKYLIVGSNDYIIVATTRPETLFGDTAIAIHPKDLRYLHLRNKKVLIPIINKKIPIIQDEYVDMKFGSGCLKVTPSHDINDEILAKKHCLEFIDIFNDDGTLNKNGFHYQGKDRFEVRKEIIKELKKKKFLVKIEFLIHNLGLSERTGVIVEPRRSMQWFLRTRSMTHKAIEAVKNGSIRFYPKKFENSYFNWMKNIRDWNISRQLWWGHSIPVYYFGSNLEDYVVASNFEEALLLARKKSSRQDLSLNDLKQDENVLDTWFSSWIWPISVFNGLSHPDNLDIKYYYPTKDLVTAPDILFFWVSRMIMAGYTFKNQKPFENVYFTGIVRDCQGKKMSKSLGNSPDPITLINKYGADGVRIGLLLSTQAGNDLFFNEELCLKGRNFTNKIWNIFRLIKKWKSFKKVFSISKSDLLAINWFESCFNKSFLEIEKCFSKYKISEALKLIYKLFWNDFCSWYIEIIKPLSENKISKFIYLKTLFFFENLLKLLHPYIPFISEEIWQNISYRSIKEALIITSWPKKSDFDYKILKNFNHISSLIKELRFYKKYYKISSKEEILLLTEIKDEKSNFDSIVCKLTKISKIIYTHKKPIKFQFSFLIGIQEYFIFFKGNINKNEQLNKIKNSIEYYKNFLIFIRKKILNKNFISNAPKKIIDLEYKKESDTIRKIKILEKRFNEINSL